MAKTTNKVGSSASNGKTSSTVKNPSITTGSSSSSSDGYKTPFNSQPSLKSSTKMSSQPTYYNVNSGTSPTTASAHSAHTPTVSTVSNGNREKSQQNTNPNPTTYSVDRNIPPEVQKTMAPIPAPSFVPPEPANGAPNITIEVRRAPESLDSAGNPNQSNLGRDTIIIYNHTTGEAIVHRAQTVSNARDGQRGTLAPGRITILNDAPGTQMPEPNTVMTIIEGQTLGGGKLNENGQAVYPDGTITLPYRIHRDVNDFANPNSKNKPTSAGCFTFVGDSLYTIQQRLRSWGVERGQTIPGLIIQEQRR